MRYLIDGYNVFFRTLKADGDQHFTSQRQKLIQELAQKIQIAKLHAQVVFDAQYAPGPEERRYIHALDVCYTEGGQTADDYIIKYLKTVERPQEYTVVTSDHHLAWAIRGCGATSQTVKDFLIFLNRLCKKKSTRPIPAIIKPPILAKTPTLHERYEAIFEEKLKSEPMELKGKPKPLVPKLSDFDRWLKIFTEKSDDPV